MIRFFLSFLLTYLSAACSAQLCQGSLGDPIVNITFGSGSNPGPPLAAAATGYQYVTNDCPNDGFYAVRNSTQSCFSSTWYTVNADHTGDPNGYFMVVNATVQPSPFYIDTVKNLCGNTTYEFAAWVLNVILPSSCNGNPSQPNLSFSIETTTGTVLQSFNSGNIPATASPAWKQFGFFFNTPAGVSDVVIRIVNNCAGGCGNDLLLDDITFRPCGPKLTPTIQNENQDTIVVCSGQTRNFSFNATVSAGYTNPFFQWQFQQQNGTWIDIPNQNSTTFNTSVNPLTPIGNYYYRLAAAESGNFASAQCRVYSSILGLIVAPLPVATAGNNGPACGGENVQLSATGGSTYIWTGPAGFTAATANPVVNNMTPAKAGNYTVTVTNASGCSATASTIVQIKTTPDAQVIITAAQVCSGDSALLSASGGTSYLWTPANGLSDASLPSPKAAPLQSTYYKVTASLANGCSDTAGVQVNVITRAIANAGPDKVTVMGNPVRLEGSVNTSYRDLLWTPATDLDNPTTLQPLSTATAERSYVITVTSNNNCGVSTDTVNVKFYNGIYIPNSFTPNGDGRNDTWSVPALNAFPDFEVSIFNRYGELVFANSKIVQPWDGRFKGQAASNGAYIYLIKYNKGETILKGNILLLR